MVDDGADRFRRQGEVDPRESQVPEDIGVTAQRGLIHQHMGQMVDQLVTVSSGDGWVAPCFIVADNEVNENIPG